MPNAKGFMNKDCHILLKDQYGETLDTFNITAQIPEDKRPVILEVVNMVEFEKLVAKLEIAVEALRDISDRWDDPSEAVSTATEALEKIKGYSCNT